MASPDMSYNTQQPHLKLSEYGRHIHRMVDHCVSIKNREERNRCANAIIAVMGQLNPQLRDVPDFKHKLWDHFFIMADFDVDVDSPYPKPSRESFQTKPERVRYPSCDFKFRHYGYVTEALIKEGIKMEEGEMRDHYIQMIANLMKRQYLNWNQDSVNDEVISQHLRELSKGKLKLPENFVYKATQDIIGKKPQQQHHGGKKQFHKGGRGKFRKKY
jgi:hypothetical protein